MNLQACPGQCQSVLLTWDAPAADELVRQWVSVQGQKLPNWLRPVVAGLLLGLCGAMVPEVMGIGDDTLDSILRGEPAFMLLLVILVIKIK